MTRSALAEKRRREPVEWMCARLLHLAQGGRRALCLAPCGRSDEADSVGAAVAATLSERTCAVLLISSRDSIEKLRCERQDLGGLRDLLDGGVIPTLRAGINVVSRPDALDGGGLDVFKHERLQRFFQQASAAADLVLVTVTDPSHPFFSVSAPLVDGIVWVINGRTTRRSSALAAMEAVKQLGGRSVGFILTRHREHVPAFVRRWFAFD